jgi:anti-sigma B factor antagonist
VPGCGTRCKPSVTSGPEHNRYVNRELFMVLDIITENGTTIITLVRRFDADSAPAVESELKKVIEQVPKKVIFDFSATEFVASAGLRVLLSTSRPVLKAGGKVALVSLSPQVRKVFEIAGFTKIFTVFGSREEALRTLA